MNFLNINKLAPTNAVTNVLFFAEAYSEDLVKAFPDTQYRKEQVASISSLSQMIDNVSLEDLQNCILIEVSPDNFSEVVDLIKKIKSNFLTRQLIVILLLTQANNDLMKAALKLGVNDCYEPSFAMSDVKERLNFLNFYKSLRLQTDKLMDVPEVVYKLPLGKRILDVVLSGLALIFLSPLFVIIAILIKLDSRGPVFYTSKRVGTGYKIFDFYKFRSMRSGADKEVANLSANNQYGNSAFFKVKDDPRITKLGSFLRQSSIDELPQLLNVVKGDMSLVGNRPLPLYEAEQLTTNEWSMRFLSPAGLTGLWQISKRGTNEVSERERKKLDNFYASHYSVWLDLKIIIKTIPALIQKEKV